MAVELSQIRERVGKFWPLLIVLVVAIVCFAQLDVSMINQISTYCDARKVMQKAGREGDSYGGVGVDTAEIKPLPHSVAITLLHYATSQITPQQTIEEVTVTLNILSRRGPCNFLVYGLGHDSPMWQAFNYGGRTVFLEEDPKWIDQMTQAHPTLEAHHVTYSTMLSQADDLLAYARNNKEVCSPRQDPLRLSDCKLAIKTLPPHAYDIEWDVIMVDAPRGYFAEAPGRMSAIFTSAAMAVAKKKPRSTDVLLHDVERHVEKTWAEEFLCRKNLREEVGKLWHFKVHGQGAARSSEFCMA